MRLKNIIGGLLLATAIICLLNAFIFVAVVNPTYELTQLWLQMACVGTAWLCFLYGMSTWFSQSDYFRQEQHLRVLMMVTLIALIIAILVTFMFYSKAMGKLGDYTVLSQVLSGAQLAFQTIALVCCIIAIILMVVVIGLLAYMTFSRYKAHQ